jgi:hypothetical protein
MKNWSSLVGSTSRCLEHLSLSSRQIVPKNYLVVAKTFYDPHCRQYYFTLNFYTFLQSKGENVHYVSCH